MRWEGQQKKKKAKEIGSYSHYGGGVVPRLNSPGT